MQMRKAINLIIILLVILIALLTAILVISNRISSGGGDGTGTGSPEPAGTTEPPAQSTDAPGTDPASSDTKGSDVTTVPSDTTVPSGETVPDSFRLNRTFSSNTGTPLNIRADVRGEKDAATGKVRVTVLLYIDYKSLYFGERKNCRLSLGDTSEIFTVPGITEDSVTDHTQFIASVERLCDYGETLSLYARVPFRGSYSDIEIDSLEIDTSITIK